jgi:hypothetical protein
MGSRSTGIASTAHNGSNSMDLQRCELVVAFEPPLDVTSYIQVTRGQALHKLIACKDSRVQRIHTVKSKIASICVMYHNNNNNNNQSL